MASTSPDPIIAALKEYTTCDVSDALVKLNVPYGGFLSGLTMWSPQRQDGPTKIVGPAYTVQYLPNDDPAPKHPTHYVGRSPLDARMWTVAGLDTGILQIDTVPEGAVIFVSCPPKIPNACYGGLMSKRAIASKAVGSVIDGRFRDLQEQRDLNYPIFARDTGTAPPQQLLKVTAINIPVRLQTFEQDIMIRPGDYLIGDLNGVVVLPRHLAEKALPLMAKQVAADSHMAVAIENGVTFSEASKRFRS